MGREEQIINERIKKLKQLRAQGINPYPAKFDKKHLIEDCLKKKSGNVKTAGRIITKRDIGKIIFSNIRDGSGEIQIVLQDKKTPAEKKEFFKKYIDSGDFVGVEGSVILTKTKQKSILVKNITILSKSILPLPDKFKGLQDEEERFRKRYLELISDNEVKEIFIKKAKFWNTIRDFLKKRGFIEVETPILETAAGGAAAKPFKTHMDALKMGLFLRISMGELWQKKLMVAGLDKTFEIGRQFRNEGIDAEHLQDYTQMEFYWAYADYEMGMKLVEEMYKEVAKKTIGSLKFKTRGFSVDLEKPWKKYDYEKTIKKYTGVDIYKASKQDLIKKINSLKIKFDSSVDKWRLVDILWKFTRKKLTGPGFLVGQPVEITPLAKRSRTNPKKVEQFQVIIAGSEMGNGYSELNDPFDQETRFIEQRKLKEAGDEEAHVHDKAFVEALKHAMPPTCGFGVSERLFSYLIDKPIRECVIFPLIRPKGKK